MADYLPYQDLSFGFAKLLEDLSASWAAGDVDFLRELVAQGEFGEAMDNLVALAGDSGRALSAAQSAAVAALCSQMGLRV